MGALDGKTALVTGASSGIGWATAAALATAGATVHAVARREERLASLAQATGAVAHALDIADTAGLERLGAEIDADILVNNAGLGAGITGLESASAADIERTIGVNVAALLQTLRVFLPGMRRRGRGHVVNIGSVAGVYPVNSAIYGGSKAAVRRLSQNLRIELRGSGIRVTEICPGRVATDFYDAAIPDDRKLMLRLKTTGIRELTSEDVAEAILYAVTVPRRVNVSTIELQPLEQSFGGVSVDPVDWSDDDA